MPGAPPSHDKCVCVRGSWGANLLWTESHKLRGRRESEVQRGRQKPAAKSPMIDSKELVFYLQWPSLEGNLALSVCCCCSCGHCLKTGVASTENLTICIKLIDLTGQFPVETNLGHHPGCCIHMWLIMASIWLGSSLRRPTWDSTMGALHTCSSSTRAPASSLDTLP